MNIVIDSEDWQARKKLTMRLFECLEAKDREIEGLTSKLNKLEQLTGKYRTSRKSLAIIKDFNFEVSKG